MEIISKIITWSNENSGFLSLVIFLSTLVFAWISGLFRMLRQRPRFTIRIIEQCSFGTIIDLQREHKGYPVTKTAFAIYLEVSNVGNAPSSIGKISLGYYKSDFKAKIFSKRRWVKEMISKGDFRVTFEDSNLVKVYPFLKQRNSSYQNDTDTYLTQGKTVNGIVYFEEFEAYGSWMPRLNKDGETTNLRIKIKDAFGDLPFKDI